MALPSDGELSVRDLQSEAFIPLGNQNDFTDLAELYDIVGYNPSAPSNIILADSFYGETLNLTATSITVTPTSLSLPNNGGGSSQYTDINVSSNGAFLIIGKPNWIGIDDVYYTSGATIRLYRFDNSSLGAPERSATIEFKGSGGTTRRTLPITQAGNPIELTLNPSTSQTLSRTANTLTQDVTVTNPLVVTGIVVGDGMTLSTPVKTNLGSTSRYRFTLSYTTNDTTSLRDADITFNITGDTFQDVRTIKHTQSRLVPSLSIATSTLSFIQGGETKSFDVVSNTDWTSDITGTGYEQSFSSTNGFTTSDLSGNENDRIYIKALSNPNPTRTGTVRVEVDGGSPFDVVYLSQAGFVETLSIATSLISFDPGGEEESFDVVSNTDWISVISGDGYKQSFSSATGFTDSNLSGNGNDRIYIEATENPETFRRDGSVSVAVSDGNPSDSVILRQNPKPIWTDSNILISGFDVNQFGDITKPSILTSLPYTITYTTSAINAGTSYSEAAGFPLVASNTIRYAKVTVDVPNNFQNPGPYTKITSAIQEERYYDTDEIYIGAFSVSDTGAITVPSISATDNPSITTTYTFGPNIGTTTTVAKGFPAVLTSTTRYVNATLTIPSGWFNTGTITRTKSTIQPGATLDGYLYFPYDSIEPRNNWSPGSIGGSYTNTSFFPATATTPQYLTFSLRTNVVVDYVVEEFGHSSFSIVSRISDITLPDNQFTTQLEGTTPYILHFRLKCNPSLISQGTSASTTMYFTTTDTSGADFQIDITLGKLQGSSVGVNPGVNPSVDSQPTVKLKPQE